MPFEKLNMRSEQLLLDTFWKCLLTDGDLTVQVDRHQLYFGRCCAYCQFGCTHIYLGFTFGAAHYTREIDSFHLLSSFTDLCKVIEQQLENISQYESEKNKLFHELRDKLIHDPVYLTAVGNRAWLLNFFPDPLAALITALAREPYDRQEHCRANDCDLEEAIAEIRARKVNLIKVADSKDSI